MRKQSFVLLMILFVLLGLHACSQNPDVSKMSEDELLEYAKTVHEKSLTLDSHVDIPGGKYATAELDPGSEETRLQCTLPKMEKGGLDGVFLAVYVGQDSLVPNKYKKAHESAMAKFKAIHRLAEEMYPDRCELAFNADDIVRIEKSGKRAIIIGVENAYPLGTEIENLKKYYDLGARYITLSHYGHNQVCTSAMPMARIGDPPDITHGLTDYGKQFISEMNKLGIIVDVSHISREAFWDIIKHTKAPVIASHGACKALNNVERAFDDDQLRAIAKNGGTVQMIAFNGFMKPENPDRAKALEELNKKYGNMRVRQSELEKMSTKARTDFERKREQYIQSRREIDEKFPPANENFKDYVDHLDHAIKITGIDYVGIGSDFDGGGGVEGFNGHDDCLNITVELLRRGYSEEEVYKIWGGNLLRVLKEVEKIASEV